MEAFGQPWVVISMVMLLSLLGGVLLYMRTRPDGP
jgi:hypothetical protein